MGRTKTKSRTGWGDGKMSKVTKTCTRLPAGIVIVSLWEKWHRLRKTKYCVRFNGQGQG